MNIVFFNVEGWEKKIILKKLKGHKISFMTGILTPAIAKKIKGAEVLSIFVKNKITQDILEELPKLKAVVTRSTGFDHIDVDACKRRKIGVCNVPTYGENTVAEHTFGLILNLARKIPKAIARYKSGYFDQVGLRGFDLKGKTLGIIGLGNIGRHVAKMAHGFEMNILAFDLHEDKEFAKKYNIKYAKVTDVIKKADILTFHVPLNPHTKHLLNKKNVLTVKKGSYVVNTSRGGVIDTEALLLGIQKGILAGIALDVLENECFISNQEMLLSLNKLGKTDMKVLLEEFILGELDNVYITAHNAYNSQEALERILDTTLDNILSCAKGKIKNRVN